MSPSANSPRPPYGLEPTSFPFPALATMAGRAPLGGPRELALACFLVARIVGDGVASRAAEALTPEQRQERVQGVKQWLASATLPAGARAALARLAESAGGDDRAAMRTALEAVMTVTANQLDSGARLELSRLAQALAG